MGKQKGDYTRGPRGRGGSQSSNNTSCMDTERGAVWGNKGTRKWKWGVNRKWEGDKQQQTMMKYMHENVTARPITLGWGEMAQ